MTDHRTDDIVHAGHFLLLTSVTPFYV